MALLRHSGVAEAEGNKVLANVLTLSFDVNQAQRRSAAVANRRTSVPLCEIERLPAAGPDQCAGQICCICDDVFESKPSRGEAKELAKEAKVEEAKEEEAEKTEATEIGELAACALPACGHVFHRRCIGRWLRLKNTCPMCRAVLPAVPKLSDLVGLGASELRRRLDHWQLSHSDVPLAPIAGAADGDGDAVAVAAALAADSAAAADLAAAAAASAAASRALLGPVPTSLGAGARPAAEVEALRLVEALALAERLHAHLSARPVGEQPEEGDDDFVAAQRPPAQPTAAAGGGSSAAAAADRGESESEDAVAAIARSISSAMDRRAQRLRLQELERHAAELELAQRAALRAEEARPQGMVEAEEQRRHLSQQQHRRQQSWELVAAAEDRAAEIRYHASRWRRSDAEEEAADAAEQWRGREALEVERRRSTLSMYLLDPALDFTAALTAEDTRVAAARAAADERVAGQVSLSSGHPGSSRVLPESAPFGYYASAYARTAGAASQPHASQQPRRVRRPLRFGGAPESAPVAVPERSAALQRALRDVGEDPDAPAGTPVHQRLVSLEQRQEHGEIAADAAWALLSAPLDLRPLDLQGPGPLFLSGGSGLSTQLFSGSEPPNHEVNDNPDGTFTITGYHSVAQ